MKSLLTTVFLLTASLYGHAAGPVDPGPGTPVDIGKKLPGRWLYTAIDDPRNALPETGTAKWHTVPGFPHDWRNPSHRPYSTAHTAWYRLDFMMSGDGVPRRLALRLGPVNDADETWFNGKLIGSSGVIDSAAGHPVVHAWDRVRLYDIPEELARRGGRNTLAIRVQGYFPSEAGFREPASTVVIGTVEDVRNAFFREQLFTLFVTVIILGAAAFFLIGFFRDRGNLGILFLGLCGVTMSMHHLATTQIKYVLNGDFVLFKRMEYAAIIATVYLFMNFVYFHFKRRRARAGRRQTLVAMALNIAGAATLVPFLFSNDFILWDRLMKYAVEPLWAVSVLFSLWIIGESARENHRAARPLLAGAFICALAAVNDVLVNRAVLPWGYVSHIGFMVFILSVQQMFSLASSMEGSGKEGKKLPAVDAPLPPAIVDRLDAVIDFLKKNYREDISREGLANMAGMSPDYLGRLFKQRTGMKIGRYINSLRIDDAREKLRHSDESVIHIAYEVGFECLRTFNRAFHQSTGMTPSRYRETHRRTS